MRSEEEIRIVLKIALEAYMTAEQEIILIDAIDELLTLRRRLEDREAIGKLIYDRFNDIEYYPWKNQKEEAHECYRKDADAIIKYLMEWKE